MPCSSAARSSAESASDGDGAVDQDLDVDLVVRGVDPGRIVDRVGIDPTAREGKGDPPALGHRQIGTLADNLGADLVAVDPQPVIGAVADLGMALVGRLDEGADAAKPQEINRGGQQFLDQLGRGQPIRLDIEGAFHFGADRDRLGGALENSAARRDQRAVVIGPTRSRQPEEPLPLGKAAFGIGLRIDKDVAVVEGGDEPDMARDQHAVAEDVARHVADADDRQIACFGVPAKLAKMALDEFPGAARGDADRLVVVAGRTARGKGVAEPEPVLLGDRIRMVGEAGGTLVGGDDEIGIVAVVSDDFGRRHDAVTPRPIGHDIVGEVQEPADEDPVAFDGLVGKAAGCGRRLLDDKAALGPDRDDDRVLDRLGLHQPENFGAKILSAIGPADAAARHPAGPHMHGFDPRARRHGFRTRAAAAARDRSRCWRA